MASVGSNRDQRIDCQTSKLFYNIIILVLLYQNDVKVNSGLVYLCIHMHFDIHICGTSLSTLRSQALLRNHMT